MLFAPTGRTLERPLKSGRFFLRSGLLGSLSPSGGALGGEEADDGPGSRLLAEVELRIRGHLGMLAADEAPVPQPPSLRGLRHRLALGLDELTAIVIVVIAYLIAKFYG